MSSDEMLRILWEQVWWVLPAALLITGARLALKSKMQGAIGEGAVAGTLRRAALDSLHDVIVPDGRGGLTQIDHLLLSRQGIVVVETKSFSGRIYGRARDKYWTQRFKKGRSARIANPLRQNYGHIKAVEAIVGDRAPVVGRVVIAGPSEWPKGMPEGVVRKRALARELRSGGSNEAAPAEWAAAWSALKQQACTDKAARQAHLAQLRERHGRDLRPVVGAVIMGFGVLLGVVLYFV